MAQFARDRSSNQMRNAPTRSSYPADWYIEDDEPVPQSNRHEQHEDRLKSILRAWVAHTGRDLLVGSELAFRWDERDCRVGVDPDVYVVEMPPRDEDGDIRRIRTWEEGNFAPLLAIEIVSKSRPNKDYSQSPEKHDYLGTIELWVFDPHLSGYTKTQAPVLLQIFQRETNNCLAQVYAGAGPYRSDVLEAWVMVIDGELVISSDAQGKDRWPTLEEAERLRTDEAAKRADEAAKRADEAAKRADDAAKRADEERAAKEAALARADDAAKRVDEERAAKEAALARVAELEARLGK